jgi:arylsulfatase A-like enzyme
MPRLKATLTLTVTLLATIVPTWADHHNQKPNVVLIMTDDQGYGEIGAHGHPYLKTPNLDQLWKESVRLTDYHVDPTCSPTRSALMSGRYSTRTGVWHTINGRSLMATEEWTVAETFQSQGYRTGMFGKWHLGDNYPSRPQDQGFDHVVWSHGGGVTQAPDYWDNDYFDDTYEVNGAYKQFKGYCTDVWFEEAMKFMKQSQKDDKPFFAYIPTNAAHSPFNVADEYTKPFLDMGLPNGLAKFYGMIVNIDENVGKMRQGLQELGLAENTIFIFTTDNGSTAVYTMNENNRVEWYNAGLRAAKGSEYDGGHRVPFFVSWPKGNIGGGKDIDTLTAHIDVLPTLTELCGLDVDLNRPEDRPLDGVSLAGLLQGEGAGEACSRTLFVHSQRTEHPELWRKSAVMTEKWRLVNGAELYDIEADRAQQHDLAEANKEVVEKLRESYMEWWHSLEPVFDTYVRIGLGGKENPSTLSSHDWMMPGTQAAPWHQIHVNRGQLTNGHWMVNVLEEGDYRITLNRWPAYINRAMDCVKAGVIVQGIRQYRIIDPSDTGASFELHLAPGETQLKTELTRAEDQKTFGSYYVTVERL